MHIQRRAFMAAGLAALAPMPAFAATPRIFHLYRGKSKIGEQSLLVTRAGGQINVAVDIDISVRIMGLPAYRYDLSSRETWGDGMLLRLDASGNDNGKAERVTAIAQGDGVSVDGSAFQGQVPGRPATTTYWSQAFLSRPVWISTQNGLPFNVTAAKAGSYQVPGPGGDTLSATRWRIRGDIGRLDLFYDQGGEWVGNEFEARGEQARFVLADYGRSLAGLWTGG
ncbi:MAG: DUF6134 family protein [Pseudomonadota bacterium]